MKTVILYSPVTKSNHLIMLDQVIYFYEITDENDKYYKHIYIRFEDGSFQIFEGEFLSIVESFTLHSWLDSFVNSIVFWIKSKFNIKHKKN